MYETGRMGQFGRLIALVFLVGAWAVLIAALSLGWSADWQVHSWVVGHSSRLGWKRRS
jgi:hypothetical protein